MTPHRRSERLRVYVLAARSLYADDEALAGLLGVASPDADRVASQRAQLACSLARLDAVHAAVRASRTPPE